MLERQAINEAATRLQSPFATFVWQAAAMGGGVAVLAAMLLPTVAWALLAFAVAAGIVGQALANGVYTHGVFGLCNTITLARAALVSILFGALFAADTVSPWLVFGIGALVLSMDGLDGWFARRSGLVSSFGAAFDVETDSALAAILAVWLMVSGTTGMEVLLLGFTRYAFVVASWAIPALRADLPPAFRRKAICVIQIAALLVLTVPILPAALVMPISFGASLALCYSFAVDMQWLLRRAA